MSGCWEIMKTEPRVVVCILHTEYTPFYWALGLRRLVWPGPYQEPIGLSGMTFDHARNQAAMTSLDMGADYLFFLDSDVIPPKDAIPRLIAHKKEIISGMYCRRSQPIAIPVMQKPAGHWFTNFIPGQLVEVDTVGAGCLLIHTDVLKRLPPQRPGKHWFDWRVDLKGVPGTAPNTSEDFSFCLHAKKYGIPTYVDTSIECLHQGLAESKLGEYGPAGQQQKLKVA